MLRDIFKNVHGVKPAGENADEENKPTLKRFKFEVNQKLGLSVTVNGLTRTYTSSIQEVYDDIIAVAAPIDRGNYVYFQKDETLQVTVHESTGMYSFATKVVGKMSGPLSMLYIYKPSQIKRFQQREYIRAKAFLPVRYSVSRTNRISRMAQKEQGDCLMRDISAGGMCLAVPEQLPDGQMVHLEFALSPLSDAPDRFLEAQAQVLRNRKDAFSDKYFTSVIFKDINDVDRDRISAYVDRNERV
jgi:c-di-GMP-binding flagellar brake protein YcgR